MGVGQQCIVTMLPISKLIKIYALPLDDRMAMCGLGG